jgi:hypothetical protein
VATRKQRRRREKEKRHEYEIVYLDDEGNEVEPAEAEAHAPARKEPAKNGKSASRRSQASGRGRVGTVLVLGGKKMTLAAALFQTLVLLVFFVPFSYFLDSFMWRSHLKRQGRGAPAKR